MKLRERLPSKGQTFAILMVAALVLAVLPPGWTAWVRGLVQVLGMPEWTLSAAARRVSESVEASREPVSPAEYQRLEREAAELRRLLWHQHAWLQDLEGRYEEVCGLRGQLQDEGTRIVVAPVLSYDSSPRRDTLLIGRGAVDKVQTGQWVAAGVPPEQRAAGETGRQILMRQWLVGRVSEVQSRVSRVRLASDPKFGQPNSGQRVALARPLEDGGWQSTPADHLLAGRGQGRMVISQADADYLKQGYELVMIPPAVNLPESLSIGHIVSSVPMEESALHFELTVEPWGDPRGLRYVYVIVTGP